MLRRQCNAVVRHYLADDHDMDELRTELPTVVTHDLKNALELEGRVLRYDAQSRTAYCLERLSPTISIWIWEDVEAYAKAANLLSRLVGPDDPIDETTAKEAYVRATGRVVPNAA
jgi:hypothetical protein